ncbi:MAG: hypothetical protein KBB94_01190 [Legionellaceae bacterium]|nr:hypothetical protein [Legionellaceae bacterium]MBP9774682.1 hypothetical protein [Legionellaceae bacterium]
MESRAREPVVYKAILDPLKFDNPRFWRGIADYKNGRLESKVFHAEETVKSTEVSEKSVSWPISHSFVYGARIVHPRLDNMLYMLCGFRLGHNADAAEDEAAMKKIVLDSLIFDGSSSSKNVIHHCFSVYGGKSQELIAYERGWSDHVNPENPYPGFIGHKDFVVPEVEQRPISYAFWLSVLSITAGTVALICAFAFMQAASLAVGGLIIAGVGAVALYKGISLFCSDRQSNAAYNSAVESEIAPWRPI